MFHLFPCFSFVSEVVAQLSVFSLTNLQNRSRKQIMERKGFLVVSLCWGFFFSISSLVGFLVCFSYLFVMIFCIV